MERVRFYLFYNYSFKLLKGRLGSNELLVFFFDRHVSFLKIEQDWVNFLECRVNIASSLSASQHNLTARKN